MASEPDTLASVKDFVGGWVGGLARIPVGHPFDTVKIRLATAAVTAPAGQSKSSTMLKVFSDIWRNDGGIRGLYRGAQSPAIGMAALNATLFVSYGHGKRWAVESGLLQSDDAITPRHEYPLGWYAGFWCSFAEGPVDFIKTQLQARSGEYRGFNHCVATIVRTHGPLAVFQGMGPTLARNIPAYGNFFAAYRASTSALASEAEAVSGKLASWKVLLAGGLAGAAFWGPTYPIDVIKSSMQADTPDKGKRVFANMADAARKIYARDGLRGFVRGFTPCIVRAMPANAAAWYGYELTQRAFALAGL